MDELREFMWSWDPYGVSEERSEVPDEYDGWILLIDRLKKRSRGPHEIAEALRSKLQSMGLPDDDVASVANQICELH